MNDMKKEIKLGYISMYDYTPNNRLFSDWMYEKDNYEEYKEEIEKTSPDEVIIPSKKKYTLIIDYPLSTPFKKKVNSGAKGRTRREVVNLIVECYKRIYEEEDKSIQVATGYITGMFNRNHTNGKYGIWGHVLGDLMLHTLNIDGNNLSVGCDS